MRKALAASAAAAALVVGGATAATAVPPEPFVITLDCDNGQTYDVVVSGNGLFTPGRALDSTTVLIPISFGDFMFRAVLPDGTVQEITDPGFAKGGGNVAARNPRPTTTCSFSDEFTIEEGDPFLPPGTVVTVTGTVTVMLTGR